MDIERRKDLSPAAQVYANSRIMEMLEIDPRIQSVLDVASDPQPRENRWIAYEALKRMSQAYPVTRESDNYATLLWAIDLLLPVTPDENEEEGW